MSFFTVDHRSMHGPPIVSYMVTKMEGGHVWQNKHQVNGLATECRQFVLSCSGLVPFTSSLQGLLPEIPTQALSLSPLRIVDSPCLSRSSWVLSSIILFDRHLPLR
jgi:hypothetical protein